MRDEMVRVTWGGKGWERVDGNAPILTEDRAKGILLSINLKDIGDANKIAYAQALIMLDMAQSLRTISACVEGVGK